MAPDKIYINNYNGNETWGNQWHTKPSTNPSTVSHAYLRKDALLEWVKEQEEKLVSDSFTSSGKRKMLKRLIEKIESL